MLHKSALVLGILCVACPLTANAESADRDTGFWLSAGLARSEIESPDTTLRSRLKSQWDNWQLAAGYDTEGWLDAGLQFDWFRSRYGSSDVGLQALELRGRAKLRNDSPVFLAPVIGVGFGWTTREAGVWFDDGSWGPLTYTARGPVASAGLDMHLQPGRWLAVVFSGSYRWSRLTSNDVSQTPVYGIDDSFKGWSLGVQIRVYPKRSSIN
jgi:hypothetical protein